MNFLLIEIHARRIFSVCGTTLGGLLLLFTALEVGGVAYPQATPPINSSGLNTQVNLSLAPPAGKVQYDITGGTRAGTNLFHSFGDFSVPTNNIANFLNTQVNGVFPSTSNILGRVNGGNPSTIFGMIQTTNFGNANLFLINPAGFLFGPNATVNVGGMMAFTTADYLRLADGVRFNAIPNAAADALLSAAPVAAFGFLGSNPAGIAIHGSTFQVAQGQTLSLVGGNQGFVYTDPDTSITGSVPGGITMTGGRLSAPGGQINLVSVASPGEILLPNLQSAPNIHGQSFTAMGNISLSQGALLDVSADAAGTVRIRGGQFVMADATISADTGNTSGASSAVDINVTGDMSISDTRGVPAITARATGTGDAGEVRISSANLGATSSAESLFPFALIDTHTSGSGKGGDVNIKTPGNLTATGPNLNRMFFIDSGTIGLAGGTGGNVMITAGNVQLAGASVNTGDFIATQTGQDSAGSGGDVMITSDNFHMTRSTIATDGISGGTAGGITISAHDVQINENSFLEQQGINGTGKIVINATDFLMNNSGQIVSATAFAPGGGISITANTVVLNNGSTIQSQTFGDAPAGDIRISAINQVTLSDDLSLFNAPGLRPSGLFTNSIGGLGNLGNAGAVIVTTPRLVMTGGARIDTTTQTSGHGGDVTITANSISITGQRLRPPGEEGLFDLGSKLSSGIFTRTIGTSDLCTGPCGDAGRVSITTGQLNLGNGASIDSSSTSTGQGGLVTIQATDIISLSGTLSDGTPGGIFSRTIGTDTGAGSGGNILLNAGQSVTISDGAAISTSSTGLGHTGNIQINAGNQFAMTNSSVTTQANQASGGAIKITTTPNGTVQLTNSTISASVLDGTGGGGSVNIDPQFVILQNSQILAQAVQGPGGNISITTNLLLPDATSVISASSQFGQNGTITIQSPISPASGKIIPLSQKPLLATTLLSQRCAALAGGEFSSFTVAGRDNLPAEPGGWLSSPLALSASKSGIGALTEASSGTIEDEQTEETPLLSLRQIAPSGFLTQAFAVDWSAGCTS